MARAVKATGLEPVRAGSSRTSPAASSSGSASPRPSSTIPKVLILDEPTIGLDPAQIIEIRELIKSLRGEHTIMLSTHILAEVTQTCDGVVIINEGRLMASGSLAELTASYGGTGRGRSSASGEGGEDAAALFRGPAGCRELRSRTATSPGRMEARRATSATTSPAWPSKRASGSWRCGPWP